MLPEIIALFFQFDEIQADAIASKIRALFPGDVFHRGPLENQTEFRASLTTAWPQFEEEARRKLPTESTIANAICDRILQWAIDLCKDQGMPLVQNFDEESASCFRARKDSHYEIARKAYSLPLEALNAPLPDSARSMRLSRAGQSFFYAGSSTGTCLAELRIPNGRSVTVGKFKFARPCQLIDLRPLATLNYKASLFQSDYAERTVWTGILRGLLSEFCQPTWDDDPPCKNPKKFDFYAPTQYFTAYMRTKFPEAEAVIYPSAQSKPGDWNVAFFAGRETLLASDPLLLLEESFSVRSVSVEITYERVEVAGAE
ncbi:MAG: RES family NAD+ phosphorylase [Xanthomonadales bacterium]|nr:RES family NAD+ phosphorylase [Xanthomonadales bacterium]